MEEARARYVDRERALTSREVREVSGQRERRDPKPGDGKEDCTNGGGDC